MGAAYCELIGDFGAGMTALQVLALIEDHGKVATEVPAVVPG